MKIRILLSSALAMVCLLCVLFTSSCCCCMSEDDLEDILDETGLEDLFEEIEDLVD